MPFTVASIKKSAANAKEGMSNTIDRQKSMPMAKTHWNPYDPTPRPPPPPPPVKKPKPAMPPPPVRHDSAANTNKATTVRSSVATPPAAPPRRSAPPSVPSSNRPVSSLPRQDHDDGNEVEVEADAYEGDEQPYWTNLSHNDKEVFFGWMDEFFGRRKDSASRVVPSSDRHISHSGIVRDLASRAQAPPIPGRSAPRIPTASRPDMTALSSSEFSTSYPPTTVHGCGALDAAHYFSPATHWETPWYNSDNHLPPILRDNKDMRYVGAMQYSGSNKTIRGAVLFSDLSLCWYTVSFSTATASDQSRTTRSAKYLPRPSALDKQALLEAHETYGETIAAFAESFDGTGQFCARGECWDLANEALKYFDQFDYVPKPVPSINRTHGHLIFEGKATSKGKQVGRWRGGDDTVRRGDIVEWRSVRINVVGAAPGSWRILGDPEHTAVIVTNSHLSREPEDGISLSPIEIGTLEVVEQSRNSPPKRQTYDLSTFEEGEMWIYRPIGMEAYIGTLLDVQCPDDGRALTV